MERRIERLDVLVQKLTLFVLLYVSLKAIILFFLRLEKIELRCFSRLRSSMNPFVS